MNPAYGTAKQSKRAVASSTSGKTRDRLFGQLRNDLEAQGLPVLPDAAVKRQKLEFRRQATHQQGMR